jgi:hypothetical protein
MTHRRFASGIGVAPCQSPVTDGGANGTRTPDLLVAKVAPGRRTRMAKGGFRCIRCVEAVIMARPGHTWGTRALSSGSSHVISLGRASTHPEGVNQEAAEEPLECRRPGPEGFYATGQWLHNLAADITWDIHHAIGDGDLVAVYSTNAGSPEQPTHQLRRRWQPSSGDAEPWS